MTESRSIWPSVFCSVLTEEQATQTAGIMYVLSDVNRISRFAVIFYRFFRKKHRKRKSRTFQGCGKDLGKEPEADRRYV